MSENKIPESKEELEQMILARDKLIQDLHTKLSNKKPSKEFIENLKKLIQEAIKETDKKSDKLPEAMKNSEFAFAYKSGRNEAFKDVIDYLDHEIKNL